MPSGNDILAVMVVMMILAGFSALVAFWISRVAGRQRIAENLLRERLARAWGVNTAPRSGEPEAR
jgi:cytochrome bd-type quinol oxidase subunit 1